MKIEVVERRPVRVAYRRHTGPFGEHLIRFWRNHVAAWMAEHGVLDCPRYGVSLDDPAHTPAERCRYDACVELPPGLSLPDAPEKMLAGGRYAVTAFKGTSSQIGEAWRIFMRECLARPDAHLDAARPPFEHYPRGSSYDPRSGAFACELCLPLVDPPR
jgi:AraC family transcriptional regulator